VSRENYLRLWARLVWRNVTYTCLWSMGIDWRRWMTINDASLSSSKKYHRRNTSVTASKSRFIFKISILNISICENNFSYQWWLYDKVLSYFDKIWGSNNIRCKMYRYSSILDYYRFLRQVKEKRRYNVEGDWCVFIKISISTRARFSAADVSVIW